MTERKSHHHFKSCIHFVSLLVEESIIEHRECPHKPISDPHCPSDQLLLLSTARWPHVECSKDVTILLTGDIPHQRRDNDDFHPLAPLAQAQHLRQSDMLLPPSPSARTHTPSGSMELDSPYPLPRPGRAHDLLGRTPALDIRPRDIIQVQPQRCEIRVLVVVSSVGPGVELDDDGSVVCVVDPDLCVVRGLGYRALISSAVRRSREEDGRGYLMLSKAVGKEAVKCACTSSSHRFTVW